MKRLAYALLVTILLSGSACIVAPYDQPIAGGGVYALPVDLSVNWQSSDLYADACGDYGVEYWTLVVDGPEQRVIVRDCWQASWDSAGELYGLAEGYYSIQLQAWDMDGVPLAETYTEVNLDGVIGVELLTLDVDPWAYSDSLAYSDYLTSPAYVSLYAFLDF